MQRWIWMSAIGILAVAAVAAMGTNASAGRGYGGGGGPCWGGQGGMGMAGLSDEDRQKLDAQRAAFFQATQGLRQDIYRKDLELRSELAKETPDATAAAGLQQELSGLEAQLEQKRLEHMLEMRKINPNAGRGWMMGGGRGPGAGGKGGCPGAGQGYGRRCGQ